jgi:hypothetical protein
VGTIIKIVGRSMRLPLILVITSLLLTACGGVATPQTIKLRAIQYRAIQYRAIQYRAIQYRTILLIILSGRKPALSLLA